MVSPSQPQELEQGLLVLPDPSSARGVRASVPGEQQCGGKPCLGQQVIGSAAFLVATPPMVLFG